MNHLNFAKLLRFPSIQFLSSSLALVTAVVFVMLGFGASSLAHAQQAHFTGYVPAAGSGYMGGQVIGTTSAQIQLNFTFDTGGEIGSVAALTEGLSSLDFANAYPVQGGGNPANGCYPDVTYSTGASCTLYVTFTPTEAGNRYGAFVLQNTSGDPIAVGYVSGTGIGPEVNYLPAVQSTIVNEPAVLIPYGVAVDTARNIYIADADNGAVYKDTFAAGTYTLSTIVSGIVSPFTVAVDGAGIVYIPVQSDGTSDPEILVETPVGGAYVQSVLTVTGLGPDPYGIAVDGKGDIFITDPSNYLENGILGASVIFELSPTGYLGGYTQSTVTSTLDDPAGIAADISGNLFVADNYDRKVYKEAVGSGGYTQSTVASFESPYGVAVDAYGNVYVTDTDTRDVYKETLQSNGTYLQTIAASKTGSNLLNPDGVAIDGFGNLYIANTGKSQVLRLDSSDAPTLNFASTALYTISSDSPKTVTIANIGNATLDFSIPLTPGAENPGTTPPSFLLNSSGPSACPVTSYGASYGATLAVGANCQLTVEFEPLVTGSISGEVVIADNAPGGTQSIPLNGSGIADVFTWPPVESIVYGNNLSTVLNATSNIPGTFTYNDSSGPVTAETVLPVGVYQLNANFTPQYGGKTFKLTMRLTVLPAVLTVTPDPKSVIYDSLVTGYTYSITGLVNGDGPSAYSGVPTITTTAAVRSASYGYTYYASNNGAYTIKTTWGSLQSANYTFVFQTAVLTILPSPTFLTVTANNLSMNHGQSVPALTYKVTGFLGADTQANETSGQPSLTTTATPSSPPGNYTITVTPGSFAQLYGNYAGINYVNGTLTVH